VNKDRIDVIRPGSRVGLKVPEISEALVLGVSIGMAGNVEYRVAWWDGAARTCEWVDAAEVISSPPERVSIGFGK
jgi:hypothetical protein